MSVRYAGQSLRWMRTLLGHPARFSTAAEAYKHVLGLGKVHTDTPPLGALVWLECGPYGDVGIAVDDDTVLRMGESGPWVDDTYMVDCYLGWSPTDALATDDLESPPDV